MFGEFFPFNVLKHFSTVNVIILPVNKHKKNPNSHWSLKTYFLYNLTLLTKNNTVKIGYNKQLGDPANLFIIHRIWYNWVCKSTKQGFGTEKMEKIVP
jgi:hypothetical protein